MCMKKQCSACLKEDLPPKPVSEFGKNRNEEDGFARHCKVHARQFNRDHRQQNRERIIARRRQPAVSPEVTIARALRSWGIVCESVG